MAKPTEDPLIKAIDGAFKVLLERALADVTVQPEGDGPPVSTVTFSPAEQIKLLDSAVVWAEKRARIVPKEPVESKPEGSKFDAIRERVNIGGKPNRRGPPGAEDASEEIH